jgi:hypothetical protein
MFGNPTILIVVLVVLAVVGIGIGVGSIGKRKKFRKLCQEADLAIKQSRHDDALKLLLAADLNWSFNSHDGSRKSHITDLEDFATVVSLLASIPCRDTSCLERLQTVTSELRTLFADRGSFGIDGRSMKREAAVRWAELTDRFQKLRLELRASFKNSQSAV